MRNSNFDTKISIVALFAASLSAAFTPEAKAQEQSPPTPYLAALTTAATHAPVAQATGPELYELALALHALGDEGGSIHAMKAAANAGHPKAQRRMGELYDTDTAYVRRDYKWSIRWYQRARAQGEIIPTQPPRSYGPSASLR